MGIYDYIALASFFLLFPLGIRFVGQPRQNGKAFFLGMFFLGGSLVAFTEFMVGMSVSRAMAMDWALLSLVWPLSQAFFFHFITQLTLKPVKLRWLLPAFNYTAAAAATFLYLQYLLFSDPLLLIDGRYWLQSPLSPTCPHMFVMGWNSLMHIVAFILLLRFAFSKEISRLMRKQALWLLTAMIAALMVLRGWGVFFYFRRTVPFEMISFSYLVFGGLTYIGVVVGPLFRLEGKEIFRAVFHSRLELIAVVDREERIIDANAPFRRIFPGPWSGRGDRNIITLFEQETDADPNKLKNRSVTDLPLRVPSGDTWKCYLLFKTPIIRGGVV